MTYRYVLLDVAQKDYEESLLQYTERSYQAAENFVKAVDYALGLICESPERLRNRFEDFYELNLQKYPFDIIYTFDEVAHLVVVHAVYHHKRDPKKKYKRK